MPILQVELTELCNHSCSYCYKKNHLYSYKETGGIDYSYLIEDINFEKFTTVIFSGGEPLLKKNTIIDLLKKINTSTIHVIILTNGLLLTESVIEEIVSNYLNITFQISIDSLRKTIHEQYRVGINTWDGALNACAILYRKAVRFEISTVLTKINFHEIEGLISFSCAMGCEAIHLMECISWNNKTGLIEPYFSLEERKVLENNVSVLKDKWQNLIDISLMPSYDNYFKDLLHHEWEGIVVRSDGTYSPDCLIPIALSQTFPKTSPINAFELMHNDEYIDEVDVFLKKTIAYFCRISDKAYDLSPLNDEHSCSVVKAIEKIGGYAWTGSLKNHNSIIECNNSMGFILKLLNEHRPIMEIANKLSDYYKIDSYTAFLDTMIAIRQLIKRDLFQWHCNK